MLASTLSPDVPHMKHNLTKSDKTLFSCTIQEPTKFTDMSSSITQTRFPLTAYKMWVAFHKSPLYRVSDRGLMPPVKLFKVAELPGVVAVRVGGLPLSWRGSHTKVERAAISPFEMIICEIALAATNGATETAIFTLLRKGQCRLTATNEPRS